ncbi:MULTISPECIES: hypothetical protein [unclassified Aeromicrobium]|uniref:hypothetical protein n=1 Tax=unclassified Aeromicrobium TaxID=2633570 RepID=UPI00288C2CD9|nr:MULTISPECIES: hypothetical protein [unclassified Aeromicrobium]
MSLYAARADLAEALGTVTGYRFDDHVPAQVEPPCGFVEPADDYVRHTDTYDTAEVFVTVRLWLLVPFVDGANDTATNDLDKFLKEVVTRLPEDYTIAGSGQPGPVTANGWLAHGIHLDLTTLTTL